MNLFKNVLLLLILFYAPHLTAQKINSCNQAKKDSISFKKPVRVYNTVRLTTAKPVIDGHLNDSCWTTGEWAGNFTQWVPAEGAKPTQQTFLKILYDDQNLYVAIRAFDKNPKKIQRQAGRRDELVGDAAGVCFDSYHDHRTGFEFDITAAGQKVDAILTNPWNADFSWNAVWYAKTALEDSAWTVEMEIPLKQLRYSSDYNQIWGLHCWRWINRLQEESDWELQSSSSPGMLYLFGELRGIHGLPKSRRVEMMVSGLGKLSTFKKEPDNPFAYKGYTLGSNIGLDSKIGLSSNFTVDLTVNPDFGQVEADPSNMNLTAFETFYDEKRPFFLEGKNIFAFDLDDVNLFYSRRIGHAPTFTPTLGDNEYLKEPDNTTIISAEKLSGKTVNGLSLGVLQSLTAREDAIINTPTGNKEVTVEPMTNYFVGRVQQDFKEGNTVLGGIITSTNRFIHDDHLNFMDRNAYSGGLDFLHHWHDKEFYIDAKLVGSSITGSREAIQNLQLSSAHYFQRPDADHITYDSTLTRLSGWGGNIKIGKGSKGNWRYSTSFLFRSPALDLNDLGYMQTADMITQSNSLSYFVTKPVSVFRTYTFGVYESNNWDFGMHYLSSSTIGNIYLEFLNKWSINTVLYYITKALDTHLLRGGSAMYVPADWQASMSVKSDYSKKVSFNLKYAFSFPNMQGNTYSYYASMTVQPYNTLKLSMDLNYVTTKDKLQYVDNKTYNGSNDYFLATINRQTLSATFRIDYNITHELSLQYYGSPYTSVGKYSDFKKVTSPRNKDFNSRFQMLNTSIIQQNNYQIDENGDGITDYTLSNPDFNFYQFRSNFVMRWEYLRGSQLYFVWSNELTSSINSGHDSVFKIVNGLSKGTAKNIFLVKLNYWFSL